MRCMF
jgi:hypothetical protein